MAKIHFILQEKEAEVDGEENNSRLCEGFRHKYRYALWKMVN